MRRDCTITKVLATDCKIVNGCMIYSEYIKIKFMVVGKELVVVEYLEKRVVFKGDRVFISVLIPRGFAITYLLYPTSTSQP